MKNVIPSEIQFNFRKALKTSQRKVRRSEVASYRD